MSIHIASRRKKSETIKREFGQDCIIIDVTSKGEMPWLQFSPFYPIGGTPVPLSLGVTAQSVERNVSISTLRQLCTALESVAGTRVDAQELFQQTCPWQLLILFLASWINRQQQEVIE